MFNIIKRGSERLRDNPEVQDLTPIGKIEYTENYLQKLDTLMIFEVDEFKYTNLLKEWQTISKEHMHFMKELKHDMQHYPEMFI